jgi:hypothetical protein
MFLKATYMHSRGSGYYPDIQALVLCPKCGHLGVAVPDGDLIHFECCGYYLGVHSPNSDEQRMGDSVLTDQDRLMLRDELDVFMRANKDRPVPAGACKDIERYHRPVDPHTHRPGKVRHYEVICEFCGQTTVHAITGKGGRTTYCDIECQRLNRSKKSRESYLENRPEGVRARNRP